MINIQFDPKGKEKVVQAAKKGWAYGKQAGLWLWHAVRNLKPSRALLMKSGTAAVLLGIAAGAGTTVQEVNKMLKQFEQSQQMMKMFSGKGLGKLMKLAGGMKGVFPKM